MNDFFEFLLKMGGMHDSIISGLYWCPIEKKLELHFEDIYSNFEGLPKYPGQQPGVIILHGISNLCIDIETDELLSVFEFLPQEDESNAVLITFSPNGRICAHFTSAEYPVINLGK